MLNTRSKSEKPGFDASENVVIYPNPANDMFYIEFLNWDQISAKNVQLINLEGKLMMQTGMQRSGMIRLYVGDVPGGIYLISIQYDNNVKTVVKKIVIQH